MKKTGRKPLPKGALRAKSVHVKFTSGEHALLSDWAVKERRSIASLVRNLVLSAQQLDAVIQ